MQESRRFRREVIAALLVLALLTAAIALFFVVSSAGPDTAATASRISAAAWLRQDAADAGPNPARSPGDAAPQKKDEPIEPPAQSPTTYAQEAEVAREKTATGDALVKSGTVQSNVPLITSLTRLGLSMGDAHALISALDGIYDFRRAKPGHMFEVRLDPTTHKPSYFRYEASIVEIYEVQRKGDALTGRKKEIQTQKKLRRFGGTIASSLYKALDDLEAHPALAGGVADILSNQVNFYKEQRPGDTFRVLVEEESLNDTFLGYGPVLALEYNGVKSGKKRFFRFAAGNAAPAYYDEKKISQPSPAISIPLHYSRISSPFGLRQHPILKRKKMHNGVDFAAPNGAPVWACKAGSVVLAQRLGPNGNLVVLRHEDNLTSYYAHLVRFAPGIKAEAKIRERQVIGYVGSTGRSTGSHLHFGLKKGDKFIDPLKYKIQPGRPVPRAHQAELNAIVDERTAILDSTPIRPATAPLATVSDTEDAILGDEELE